MEYIYQPKEKVLENLDSTFTRLNSLVNMVVGATNTIAGRCLYEAYEDIVKDKSLYRFEIKRHVKEAKRLFDNYEKIHLSNFGDRYKLFLDYLDSIEDEVMPHINIMRYSIKNILDKYREPNSDLKAKIEVARVMIEYSCGIYDKILKETRNAAGFDFNKLMRPARLTGVLHHWSVASSLICKTDKDIDLNSDKNCVLSFSVIEKVLTSEDTFNKCGKIALKHNIEVVKDIAPDDYAELRKEMRNE